MTILTEVTRVTEGFAVVLIIKWWLEKWLNGHTRKRRETIEADFERLMADVRRRAEGEAAAGYFRSLGLPPTAGEAEVKKAYRRLAAKVHPDVNGGSDESTRLFQLLGVARRECLAHAKNNNRP